ncbi:hypothetical protein JCGZ_14736 [Jatropha curcas]|uniref:AAA+ ATPase domain-containing protein n=1 Tax=Jatropha curcas TaxID=180498 RepID=A0A067KBX7_JATCU|nr:AAA-ATPase At3g50940 [Jatropha curcas]KDP32533.1 hypothetical protein JCGZ_14736 [Jatropha curcas]
MFSLQNISPAHFSSHQILTIVIEEYQDHHHNQLFQAAHTYLSTIVNASKENKTTTIVKDQEIHDVFRNVQVSWKLVFFKAGHFDFRIQYANSESELRSYQLSFHKKYKEIVLNFYLPYILERKEPRNKVQKLKLSTFDRQWKWEVDDTFDNSTTFKNLVMDAEMKKTVLDDLNMFMKAKEMYGRIGRAWNRSYLFYGPSGSGKSSLIAAMANHIKYDIYELDPSIWCQPYLNFHRLMDDIPNRSILVIKDIDCNVQPENHNQDQKETLQLLQVTDGLWSHCRNEYMIIFTARDKERVNPALMSYGRIDMHIKMSYCNIFTFKKLVSHYHGIQHHKLFQEIEELIENVEVTNEEVLGELMKSNDVRTALQGLVEFLQWKKVKLDDEAEISINKEAKE